MKHGSLFSGIGGFDLGFERAGIETIWQVEIDPYCRRVLERHFPTAERFSDIRECGAHNLTPVDVLSGGFPCQDISNAGKRAGIDGERSGLWSEYARIIRELRPRYVVVENVAALLGRGMERVLGDLAAIGYDAEWQSIRASDVGAPHRRERIWIVAYATGNDVARRRHLGTDSRNTKCFQEIPNRSELDVAHAESRGLQGLIGGQGNHQRERTGYSPERHRCFGDAFGGREALADAVSAGLSQRILQHGISTEARIGDAGKALVMDGEVRRAEWWAIEPNVGRVAHGVPARVDRLRGLGNAIIPQIAEWIGKRLMEA